MALSQRWVWAGGGLALLVVAVAATSRPLALFELPPDPGLDNGPGVHTVGDSSSWDMWADPGPARALTSATGLLSLAFLGVLLVAIVVFVVVLVRAVRGRRLAVRREAQSVAGVRFDRVTAARPVAAVVEASLGQLQDDGPISDAVIACWVDLLGAAERHGLPRAQSETSAQYAFRLGSELDVSSTALQTLAALYREARFSEHALGDAERARAVAALGELQAGLRGARAGGRGG